MAKAAKQDNVVELKRNSPAEDVVKAINLAKIKRANDALQTAKNEHQSVIKHVEAKGTHLKAAARAIKIQKSGKTEDVVAELQALFEYLMILGVPLTKQQLDLFRVEEPRTPGVDKAKQHGRYIGIMGLGMDENPYAPDSELGQEWIKAWHGGNEERGYVIKMDEAGDELIKGDGNDDVFDDEGGEDESVEAAE